jgi:hypothetical protein
MIAASCGCNWRRTKAISGMWLDIPDCVGRNGEHDVSVGANSIILAPDRP